MTEKLYEISVGEAADIIATAQRLIEAGVKSGDRELIEVGKIKWKKVWSDKVVDQHVREYIKDLEEEFTDQLIHTPGLSIIPRS